MKQKSIRILSMLLALALCVSFCACGQAPASSGNSSGTKRNESAEDSVKDESQKVYDAFVQAWFSPLKSRPFIHLYYDADTVYIDAGDLACAAKMQVSGSAAAGEKAGTGTDHIDFTREGSVFSYSRKVKGCLAVDGRWYVPLRETAKALHVRYMYDETNRTLVFQHTENLPEDLIDHAKFILGESKRSNGVQAYDLSDIAGTFDAAVASAFNVLVDKGILAGLIDLATGKYGEEKYSKAIGSILSDSDTKKLAVRTEAFLKDVDDGVDAYVDIVSNADKLTVTIEDDLEKAGVNLFEQFGEYALTFGFRMSDADQILKTYHELEAFGPADFMALYHKMTLREQSNMLYIRAFNYGLGMNEYITDERELQKAIDEVFPFTKNGETESKDIILYALNRTSEKFAGKFVKSFTKELKKGFIKEVEDDVMVNTRLSVEGIIESIASKLFSKFSVTKKRTEATEQCYLLSQIQYYAAAAIRGHSYPDSSDYDPVAL